MMLKEQEEIPRYIKSSEARNLFGVLKFFVTADMCSESEL